jgi:phosphoglycolate phosphatase
METARRAAIESVGVSWGFRTVRELNEAYADHIIDSPQQLLSLL